jgi:release factor glutamine methyltransferase
MTETELLFTETLNCDRLSLYQNKDLILRDDKSIFISNALKRRASGEPIQYILGKTEFMGLEFRVTPDVLIPRPETEILVETVIDLVASRKSQVAGLNVLDIGTGSGNIAISLAKLISGVKVTATDISDKALELARGNAELNNVAEKLRFIKSNLFTCYLLRDTRYDTIVSNPPYIPTQEISNLQPEIQYEPRVSLDGGEDGLGFFRKIIKDAPKYLNEGGFMILEMGFSQRKDIENIFKKTGIFEIIEVVKDYSNIDRVIVAKWTN